MKKLNLENTSYRYLEQSFTEWLDILGYAPKTIQYMGAATRELLCHLEQKGVAHIRQMGTHHLKSHYAQLKQRPNKSRAGGLGNGTLNEHITSIRKFLDYLRQVGRLDMPQAPFRLESTERNTVYLTEAEIKGIFKATYQPLEVTNSHWTAETKDNMMAAHQLRSGRDRAMLAVYYGCGLRRNEGVQLDISDIGFDRSLLHVRKGKNNKERFVPISKASLQYLTEYIYDHRPGLLEGKKTEALFIGQRSRRLDGQTQMIRLKKLQYLAGRHQTGNTELIEKEIGLHTLRHSIATHLLAAGMQLENISRFLGHSSLESTQVYTHLAAEAGLMEGTKTGNQPFNNIPRYETTQLHEDEC